MDQTNFLRILILWVTLSQGFALSSNNLTEDSSDHLVRKRRVIDRTPNVNTRVGLQEAFYVVNIKKNEIHACAGSILAARIILTTAICIVDHARYTVVSGTLSTISGGTSHVVTGILRHPMHIPPFFVNDIALLSIHPPISFGLNINRPIQIFHSNVAQLPTNTIVTVSGYGCTNQNRRGGVGCFNAGREEPRLVNPNELRSIRLPTISVQDCRARRNNNPFITNQLICTFHEDKSCSRGEIGNPLVYNGQLVGLLVTDGSLGRSDVFVSVALPQHRDWILSHMSPESIPPYIPPPEITEPHHHNRPEICSRIHPCNTEINEH